MKRLSLLLVLVLASCAASPIQRQMQYAQGIRAAQDATVTALDFDLMSPEDGERVQAVLRIAIADLKRAIAERRAGQPDDVTDRILDLVDAALSEASRLLATKGVK